MPSACRLLAMPAPEEDPLERAIAGALRDTIKTHGPITPQWIGSAVKRIVGNLRNAKIEAHARALGQRRWKGVSAAKSAAHHSAAGKSAWSGMTDEEKSEEMSRRRRKGLARKRRGPVEG